jgi:hypothetical protein
MTITEKMVHSSPQDVRLYKEGVFWVAYEQSACLISRVKPLKVTKKYVKVVEQEVVSVGFPDTVLDKVLALFSDVRKDTHLCVCTSPTAVNNTDYQAWKQAIQQRGTNNASVVAENTDITVLDKIRFFDLSNATPVMCMIFVSELKKMI